MTRVLIVDDDRSFLAAAVEFLAGKEFDVVGIDTFPQAVRWLEGNSPDVLITDVRLGDYNGLYLLLRFKPSHPSMAALVISGYPDEVIQREALQYGARECFIKPISLPALCEHIRMCTASKPERRWPRRELPQALAASVDGAEAWITNVSYGGLLLDLAGHPPRAVVPKAMNVFVPSLGLELRATPVWVRPCSPDRHFCGARLAGLTQDCQTRWQSLVDAALSA